jgi:membrane protease YdiL (CAAX protease family)
LLPLIILYELGSALYLTTDESTVKLISAQALLLRLFNLFGLGSIYLPGVLLVVILLIWHVLVHDPWRIRWRVLGLMLAESAIWTLPLIVLGGLVYRLAGGVPHMVVFSDAEVASLSLPGRAAISIGAGLYEELLFRMVAIALVHLVAADLLRMKEFPARVVAIVLSAIAFGLYHDVATAAGGIDWPRLTVLVFAGLYFGALYVSRGFGIVVGIHALYDLTVLVIFPQATQP